MQIYFMFPIIIAVVLISLLAWHLFVDRFAERWLFKTSMASLFGLLVGSGIMYGMIHLKFRQIEHLNGVVIGKTRDVVSCEHSYSCNCTKNKDGSESCSTCLEHFYDINWLVNTTVGDVIINRVDRQGISMPPAYARAYAGEPAAVEHSYMDYLRASENTIYKKTGDNSLPGITDYYKLSHVIGCNKLLDNSLTEHMRDISSLTQANVTAICGSSDPRLGLESAKAYYHLKKNDVLVYIQADSSKIISASGTGLSETSEYKSLLNEQLSGIPIDSVNVISERIKYSLVNGFRRIPMAEFEYLKYDVELSWWQFLLIFMAAILSALGFNVWMRRL